MTWDQGLAFGIIGCTVGLFVWGRLAYDLVAVMSLAVSVLVGLVPVDQAFSGFGNEVVVIIAAALVVSAGIARSGVVDRLMHSLIPHLRSTRAQVPVLVVAVGLLSSVCKNVGALAIFMPTALQLAHRHKRNPGRLLMPMSFASLLGGLATLIGTAPNILIADVRRNLTGTPFGMFSYAPVGAAIAVVGFIFLFFGYRLVPADRKPAGGLAAAFNFEPYTTEATIPAQSPLAGRTCADLERESHGDVTLGAIIRERFRRITPTPQTLLRTGDVLLLDGDPDSLERLVARTQITLASSRAGAGHGAGHEAHAGHEVSVVEAVVTVDSPLVGQTPGAAAIAQTHGLDLLAVSRSGEKIGRRLASLRFRPGDVVVMRGGGETISAALGALRILPLAQRRIALGASHRSLLPLLVLTVAMLCAAAHVLAPGIAFFVAAIAMVLLRVLSMEEAYHTVEWHVVVMLAALIPVSHAVQTTGGSALIAHHLSFVLQAVPPMAALTIVLVLAMLLTPLLHNAPTVLMLGPIAGTVAIQLHLNPDAFLMAVAIGAGSDFLTPIGHQCNTLIYAPGGFRFGDYARLGLPMSLLVIATAIPMIALVWGLHA